MSWSVSHSGTQAEVVEKLQKSANEYEGQSKAEYEAALPQLIGLVQRNDLKRIVINGNGHSSFDSEGVEQNSYCNVDITSNRV